MRSPIVTVLLGVFIGFLFGELIHSPIHVKYEVTAGEILNAITTILLAAVVANYFTTRATTRRVEKDLLLQNLEAVEEKIIDGRDLARRSRGKSARFSVGQRREVLVMLGDAMNGVSDLARNLSLCGRSLGRFDTTALRDAVISYKSALTRGAFPSRELDDRSYIESEQSFEKLRDVIARLRFEINRR